MVNNNNEKQSVGDNNNCHGSKNNIMQSPLIGHNLVNDKYAYNRIGGNEQERMNKLLDEACKRLMKLVSVGFLLFAIALLILGIVHLFIHNIPGATRCGLGLLMTVIGWVVFIHCFSDDKHNK